MNIKTIITIILCLFVAGGLVVAIINSSDEPGTMNSAALTSSNEQACTQSVCQIEQVEQIEQPKNTCSGNCATCSEKTCTKSKSQTAALAPEQPAQEQEQQIAPESIPASDSTVLIAYYFHGDKRCITCKHLEEYTLETLQSNFADKLAAGKIKWEVINTDTPENAHYVSDFKLFSKSVVLVNSKDGKIVSWRNLDKIWQLVKNKDAYMTYIKSQTSDMLEEKN